LMDPAAPRSANVDVHLRDGRMLTHFTRFAPGTKENPLDTAAVAAKASSLIAPVLGGQRSQQIIERVNSLDALTSIRDLVRLLVA
jgi:2-methylcitrate dehydratase PrpD